MSQHPNTTVRSVEDLARRVAEYFDNNTTMVSADLVHVVDLERAIQVVILREYPRGGNFRTDQPIWIRRMNMCPEGPSVSRTHWILTWGATGTTSASFINFVLALVSSHVEEFIQTTPIYSLLVDESKRRRQNRDQLIRDARVARDTHHAA